MTHSILYTQCDMQIRCLELAADRMEEKNNLLQSYLVTPRLPTIVKCMHVGGAKNIEYVCANSTKAL